MTDERLVSQAQLKATGANIHAVKTVIALYRLMDAVGRQREAHDVERELRTFVQGNGRAGSPQAASIVIPVSVGREPLPRQGFTSDDHSPRINCCWRRALE